MTYKALLYHGPASAYILHPELYKELSKCQAPFKARTFHCRRLHILCGQRACMLSCVWLSGTPWTAAHQAPLLTAFPRQEYWSGSPCPPPEGLPDPGIELASLAFPALQVDSLPLSHWGSLTPVLKSRWPVTFSQVLWHCFGQVHIPCAQKMAGGVSEPRKGHRSPLWSRFMAGGHHRHFCLLLQPCYYLSPTEEGEVSVRGTPGEKQTI